MLGPSTVDELSAWWPAPAQGSWFSRAVRRAPSLDPKCPEVVLPVGIEPTTSPLPRECSTTELRQRPGLGIGPRRDRKVIPEVPAAGKASGLRLVRGGGSSWVRSGGSRRAVTGTRDFASNLLQIEQRPIVGTTVCCGSGSPKVQARWMSTRRAAFQAKRAAIILTRHTEIWIEEELTP